MGQAIDLRSIAAPGHLTTRRIAAALGVAVAADLIQLPLTFAFLGALGSTVGIAATVPIEAIDLAVDVFAACVTTWLLGFHWVLLPTAILEAIPGLDAAPTWTACVIFVIWRRKHDANAAARDLAYVPSAAAEKIR